MLPSERLAADSRLERLGRCWTGWSVIADQNRWCSRRQLSSWRVLIICIVALSQQHRRDGDQAADCNQRHASNHGGSEIESIFGERVLMISIQREHPCTFVSRFPRDRSRANRLSQCCDPCSQIICSESIIESMRIAAASQSSKIAISCRPRVCRHRLALDAFEARKYWDLPHDSRNEDLAWHGSAWADPAVRSSMLAIVSYITERGLGERTGSLSASSNRSTPVVAVNFCDRRFICALAPFVVAASVA